MVTPEAAPEVRQHCADHTYDLPFLSLPQTMLTAAVAVCRLDSHATVPATSETTTR